MKRNKRQVVLLLDNSRAFGRGLIRGIAKYSRLHGHWTFYRGSKFYTKVQNKDISLETINADGAIVNKSYLKKISAKISIPIIVTELDEPVPNYSNIVTDDTRAGEMGAAYLLEQGFKTLGFCGFRDMCWSNGRCEGFMETLRKAGVEPYIYQSPKSSAARTGDQELPYIAKWLTSLPLPIAILACNDDRAQQVSEVCNFSDLCIPEDVALIGIDNDDLVCELSDPPLTSIEINSEKAGYEAAEQLDMLISDRKNSVKDIVAHPTQIVARQSTGVLQIANEEVRRALQFIRSHSKQALRVDDVVGNTHISRRMLEQQFRDVLGRSIYDEIRRVRCEHVSKLLLETKLSITRIAMMTDFTGVENIARFFRKEKGMSLQAYRKKYVL